MRLWRLAATFAVLQAQFRCRKISEEDQCSEVFLNGYRPHGLTLATPHIDYTCSCLGSKCFYVAVLQRQGLIPLYWAYSIQGQSNGSVGFVKKISSWYIGPGVIRSLLRKARYVPFRKCSTRGHISQSYVVSGIVPSYGRSWHAIDFTHDYIPTSISWTAYHHKHDKCKTSEGAMLKAEHGWVPINLIKPEKLLGEKYAASGSIHIFHRSTGEAGPLVKGQLKKTKTSQLEMKVVSEMEYLGPQGAGMTSVRIKDIFEFREAETEDVHRERGVAIVMDKQLDNSSKDRRKSDITLVLPDEKAKASKVEDTQQLLNKDQASKECTEEQTWGADLHIPEHDDNTSAKQKARLKTDQISTHHNGMESAEKDVNDQQTEQNKEKLNFDPRQPDEIPEDITPRAEATVTLGKAHENREVTAVGIKSLQFTAVPKETVKAGLNNRDGDVTDVVPRCAGLVDITEAGFKRCSQKARNSAEWAKRPNIQTNKEEHGEKTADNGRPPSKPYNAQEMGGSPRNYLYPHSDAYRGERFGTDIKSVAVVGTHEINAAAKLELNKGSFSSVEAEKLSHFYYFDGKISRRKKFRIKTPTTKECCQQY